MYGALLMRGLLFAHQTNLQVQVGGFFTSKKQNEKKMH